MRTAAWAARAHAVVPERWERPARRDAARPGFAAPRVDVEVGPWLPGAGVRLAPAMLVAAVAGLAGAGDGALVVLLVLAAALVLRPALPAVAGVVLVVGLVVFAGPDLLAAADAGLVGLLGVLQLALLVGCLDAAVRVAALTPHVAWSARVEWSVVARLGRSFLATQAVAQPMLWLAYALRATGPEVTEVEALRLVAVVAIAVLVVLLVPRRGRPGPDA